MVEGPAGRRHDHVDAGLEGPQLAADGLAAVDRHDADPELAAVMVESLGDLHGQLAGRHQDQGHGLSAALRRGRAAEGWAARTPPSFPSRWRPVRAGRAPGAGRGSLPPGSAWVPRNRAWRARRATRDAGPTRRRCSIAPSPTRSQRSLLLTRRVLDAPTGYVTLRPKWPSGIRERSASPRTVRYEAMASTGSLANWSSTSTTVRPCRSRRLAAIPARKPAAQQEEDNLGGHDALRPPAQSAVPQGPVPESFRGEIRVTKPSGQSSPGGGNWPLVIRRSSGTAPPSSTRAMPWITR